MTRKQDNAKRTNWKELIAEQAPGAPTSTPA